MPDPEEIAAEVNRRANLLDRLLRTNKRILGELDVIQDKLENRPTRGDSAYQRRVSSLLLLAFLVLSMWVTDWHVENCGPGARAEAVITAVGRGEIDSREELERVAAEEKPYVCGVIYPIHSHVSTKTYPTERNFVGFAFWAFLFGGLIIWARRPKRWDVPHTYEDQDRIGPDLDELGKPTSTEPSRPRGGTDDEVDPPEG